MTPNTLQPNLCVNRRTGGGSPFASASFLLPLNDLGSGEVNLVPARAASPTPTFARATTKTTISPAGLVIPVGSGIAASYYDPTTLQYMGYLPEGQRTNLLLRSEEFDNASWGKTDTTITADAIVSPDGTQNADLLTEGTAGTALVLQAVTATADVNYAHSRFFKFGNCQWVRLLASSGANQCGVWFDIQNGVVGTSGVAGTGALVSANIKAYPNGWYRCTAVVTIGSGATAIASSTLSASGNGSGRQNNATYYAWGAQFENNVSFASSYIPTAGSTVTRNADVLTYPFAGNADATQGTAYAELWTEWDTLDSLAAAFAVIPTNINSRCLYCPTSNAATVIAVFDGTTVLSKSALSSMATGIRKRASSWGGSGQLLTGDGVAPSSAVFDGSMGPGTGNIGIGVNPVGTNNWFGTIKNVSIWQSQLSAAQLQALTA